MYFFLNQSTLNVFLWRNWGGCKSFFCQYVFTIQVSIWTSISIARMVLWCLSTSDTLHTLYIMRWFRAHDRPNILIRSVIVFVFIFVFVFVYLVIAFQVGPGPCHGSCTLWCVLCAGSANLPNFNSICMSDYICICMCICVCICIACDCLSGWSWAKLWQLAIMMCVMCRIGQFARLEHHKLTRCPHLDGNVRMTQLPCKFSSTSKTNIKHLSLGVAVTTKWAWHLYLQTYNLFHLYLRTSALPALTNLSPAWPEQHIVQWPWDNPPNWIIPTLSLKCHHDLDEPAWRWPWWCFWWEKWFQPRPGKKIFSSWKQRVVHFIKPIFVTD